MLASHPPIVQQAPTCHCCCRSASSEQELASRQAPPAGQAQASPARRAQQWLGRWLPSRPGRRAGRQQDEAAWPTHSHSGSEPREGSQGCAPAHGLPQGQPGSSLASACQVAIDVADSPTAGAAPGHQAGEQDSAEWDEESPELQRSDSPELPPVRGQAPGPGQERGDGMVPKRRLTTQASEAAAAVLQAITVASTVPRSPVPGPVQVSDADAAHKIACWRASAWTQEAPYVCVQDAGRGSQLCVYSKAVS